MALRPVCIERLRHLVPLLTVLAIFAGSVGALLAGTSKPIGGKSFQGPLVADGAIIEPVFADRDIEQVVGEIRSAGHTCHYVHRMDLMPGNENFARIEVDCDDWQFGYSVWQQNGEWVVERYF